MKPDDSAVYLTPQGLSERWQGQIKVQTLAKWRSLRRGPPYVKFGGRVLYRLADLEAFEAARSKGAG